jgi:ATP-dependent DNA ligase
LQQRIHPADSRVRLLSQRTPAHYVAFDLLALGDRDLTREPFSERRRLLEEVLLGVQSPLHVTPSTLDPAVAERWFDEFEGAGLDGIVAKPLAGTYQQDRRVMFKIKHVRTADCVVAGYRTYKGDSQAVGSLLLGLYDDDGELEHVGVVGAFPIRQRHALFTELQPLVITFEGHPWNWGSDTSTRTPHSAGASRWSAGKDLTFVPLQPERVVEVRYDYMEGNRFRHVAQFVRWRPDREPSSCTFSQLEQPVRFDLSDVLAGERPGQATLTRLEQLPNVGPAIAAKLRQIDILTPADLVGRDPYVLFDQLSARTGKRHDPCLLDVFIAVTRFMDGGPERPWWEYTAERKARLGVADDERGKTS